MSQPIIIHLRSAEFFGGPERAILGQCQALNDYKIICASFVRGDRPNRFLKEAASSGFEIAEIKDRFPGDWRVIGQIKNLIMETGARLLICHDYKANFFGRFAATKTGIPQVAHFRGYTTEDRKVRLYNYINSMLLRKIPLVLAVSEKSGLLLQSMGVPAGRIRVVPNAIEQSKLIDHEFKRIIDTSRPIRAICAGRLSYEKGYDVLINAIGRLRGESILFQVDIYGHGPEDKKLERMVKDTGLDGQVNFKGFVDDILPILRDSDFLILPSRSEGMPNILLEAWSQKLGVVATAVGGVTEMIRDGENGLLSPSEDAAKLGEKLAYALANPSRIVEFGEKGYSLVRERYNYRHQAESLHRIYNEIIWD